MKKQKKQFGQRGEQWAVDFLKRRNYAIVEVNWHCSYGEIDIVARQGETLVFVEVRSRHGHTTEAAFVSIDQHKRHRMQAAAQHYLMSHTLENIAWRIDVIAIAVPRYGSPIIEHLENALDW